MTQLRGEAFRDCGAGRLRDYAQRILDASARSFAGAAGFRDQNLVAVIRQEGLSLARKLYRDTPGCYTGSC